MTLWLVGAGNMARAYSKVLLDLDISFEVIGRGLASAIEFEEVIGKKVHLGTVLQALSNYKAPQKAIISVGIDQLANTADLLIRSGTKIILLEKPAGMNLDEVSKLNDLANFYNASVFVAYNRRFYGSVFEARKAIDEDGGVLSAQFEFTEWSHIVESLDKIDVIKQNWLVANSSHVIDLVFHLIGTPRDWSFWSSGSLNWHRSAARFAGAGLTDRNVVFSYLADWESAGRWGVDLFTSKRRLILRPIEQLQIMYVDSGKTYKVGVMDDVDVKYKAGVYRQTKAFCDDDYVLLCPLYKHLNNMKIYTKMAGYV